MARQRHSGAAGHARTRSNADVSSPYRGKWAFQGKSGGAFNFRERITNDPAGGGTCATPVDATVSREGAKLRVRWSEPRTGDSATMLAKKT